MKVRLKTSIIEYAWKEEFKDGLKAGDLEGQTTYDEEGRKDVLYCQKHVYSMSNVKMYVVEFEKNLDDVFIDWDETEVENDDEMYEKRPKTYGGIEKINDEKIEDYGFFGSYVMEIKKKEIIRICEIRYDDGLNVVSINERMNE